MTAILYDYPRSTAAYRVRIALNLKRIAYEARGVNLLEGEQKGEAFRARNPQGFVPMLEIDGERIVQSLAIIGYLDAVRPEPRLLPEDPAEAAHVRALALIVACDIHPLNNLRVLKYLSGPLGLDEAARADWYANWVRSGFAAIEALAARRSGRFLFGDTPTLADICLIPQMFNARRFDVPIDDFPLLLRIDEEAQTLDAFAKAHPERVGETI